MAKKSYSDTDGGNNPRGTKSPKKSVGTNFNQHDTASAWFQFNPELVTFLVHAVTLAGGAIMLGRSSDGGVLTIRIYHDDYERTAIYLRPTRQDDINGLVMLANEFATLAGIAPWS